MQPVSDDRKPVPDPDRPGVYRVPLSRGRFAVIDGRDMPAVSARTWRGDDVSNYGSGVAYYQPDGCSCVLLHRFLLGATGRHDRVEFVSGDTLDCRRENLSGTNWTRQGRRKRKLAPAASPYKGVTRDHKKGLWVARITLLVRKRLYLGRYKDESRAALAYDRAAAQHFGEDARLNFPGNGRPAGIPGNPTH